MLIKDAWRDHVMHARTDYDESTARIILIAVGAAMSKLAERYPEEGTEPVPAPTGLTGALTRAIQAASESLDTAVPPAE